MAHDWDVLPHIMEIKERLASIEANVIEQKDDLKEHAARDVQRSQRIEKIEAEMNHMKGSIAVLKWMAPTAPAVILAILKWLQFI